jgi:hypothetical protein
MANAGVKMFGCASCCEDDSGSPCEKCDTGFTPATMTCTLSGMENLGIRHHNCSGSYVTGRAADANGTYASVQTQCDAGVSICNTTNRRSAGWYQFVTTGTAIALFDYGDGRVLYLDGLRAYIIAQSGAPTAIRSRVEVGLAVYNGASLQQRNDIVMESANWDSVADFTTPLPCMDHPASLSVPGICTISFPCFLNAATVTSAQALLER